MRIPSLKILFLDDDTNRHTTFSRLAHGYENVDVDFVFNAADAINKLGAQPYDLVMLDHDLGGEAFENTILDGVEDGRFVVRWVVANSNLFENTTFVVHSLNAVGRKAMIDELRSAGLSAIGFPFGWREITFENCYGVSKK